MCSPTLAGKKKFYTEAREDRMSYRTTRTRPTRRDTTMVPNWILWIALIVTILGLFGWAMVRWSLGPAIGMVLGSLTEDWDPTFTAAVSAGLIAATVSLAGYVVTWLNTRRQLRGQQEMEDMQAQDDTLQAYLGEISDLASKRATGNAEEGEVAAKLIQARTVTALLALGPARKRVVLTLLYELEWVSKDKHLVDLHYANLTRADLRELTLRDIKLRLADLRAADLSGADLRGADLSEADLRGADLAKVNFLPYDTLYPERLSAHRLAMVNLSKVNLSPRALTYRESRIIIVRGRHFWPTFTELTPTNLRGTTLANARLAGAYLGGAKLIAADLSNAQLRDASLIQADLREANLSGADLREANLSNALGISEEELDKQAYSLEDATMPNGQKYEEWLKSRGEGDSGS